MSNIVYDVEDCSENYKKFIRCAKYGDTIEKTTKENIVFICNDKKYTIKFILKYAFDFENGFIFTEFSDFKSSRKTESELMDEFISHIKSGFVTSDRLSC